MLSVTLFTLSWEICDLFRRHAYLIVRSLLSTTTRRSTAIKHFFRENYFFLLPLTLTEKITASGAFIQLWGRF